MKRVFIDMDNVLVDFQSGLDQVSEEIKAEYAGRLDEIPGLFGLMKPMPGAIEASNTRGFSWSMRYRCSGMGNIRALTMHKGEIILCSDLGIYFSKNSGKAWAKRNSSERNFVDIQDMGSELIATTSDGHVYASSSGGFSWFIRQ